MGQQQDNFMGGFLLGTIVGGVLGGVTGVLASSRLASKNSALGTEADESDPSVTGHTGNRSIGSTRRSLEDKIAQLNEAIDGVRQQLNNVETSSDNGDQAIVNDGP